LIRAIPVVINRGGGAASRAGNALEGQITEAFAAAGLAADIHLVDGSALTSTIARCARTGAVAIGGGDGTQGSAAAILAEAGATQGVLPLGTRNNLARELGIPLDLAGAAKVIADGHTQAIDLGTVNGKTFVNNASLGIYPKLVELREAERARTGVPKWIANVPASWSVLRNLRHHRFRLTLDGATEPVVTPLLFIGNNLYSLDAGKVGTRDALDDGKMSVFAVARNTRWGLVGFAIRTLRGKSDPDRDFATVGTCKALTVAGRRRIRIALDGEVTRMTSPLHFEIAPGALKVFVPG
jgi:diacylglycerol kinase family enzyme